MTALAAIMSGVLTLVALLHLLWASGLWWPFGDEQRLVRTVVGVRGATRMPGPIPCVLVALAMIAMAAVIWVPVGWMHVGGMIVATVVFTVRGTLSFRDSWRQVTPQQPFARLDRRIYGPLFLGLAVGYLILIFAGF